MNLIHKTFQLRAYTGKPGHDRLDEVLRNCAHLYNAALEEWKAAYRHKGHELSVSRMENLDTHRLFVCQACGLVMDRDQNAARNIEARAFRSVRARGNEPALSGVAPYAQLGELSPAHGE